MQVINGGTWEWGKVEDDWEIEFAGLWGLGWKGKWKIKLFFGEGRVMVD